MQRDGRFRFDNFVVGSANRLAVAAARAVAESPGNVYNPLFVYSGSGLGKTHLLAAMAHHAVQLQPDLTVEYVSLDDFVEQLHASISAGQTDAFKRRWQEVSLLLVDDVQFLTGRRETQNEMLRLFNVMQGSGRQIVMASDRPPTEIPDVDERLVTRLSGGLIVDIGAPDYETRVAILRAKAHERGALFEPGVLEALARHEWHNVRELQGALNRLAAYQSLGESVRPETVASIVGEPRGDGRSTRPTPLSGVQPSVPPPRSRAETPRGQPVQPTPPAGADEFQVFLTDIAQTVAQHVEEWRLRIGEAVAFWKGEGYRTSVLERAMGLPRVTDVEGLLTTYTSAVEHLRSLEARAAAVDPQLGSAEVFRDPERVGEAEELVDRALAGQTPPPGPSAAFSRETLEVGSSNQIAVGAADAVIEEPGRRYNPLFVHGPVGTGKTHLVNAIGNGLIEASGGAMTVACVSAQQFVDELIAALQEGTIERWRARYRAVDALIVDDVHALAGKERTQDELFHLFNAMTNEGKQVVLASDRAPKEIAGLEPRLRSRFEGGLVVAVQHPDRVLRKKMFARLLSQAGASPDPELLSYLAERQAVSVREVSGLVQRLLSAADLADAELTLDFAKQELDGADAASAHAPAASSAIADPFFLDDEKVVWDWPDVAGRIIEELR